MVPKAVRTTLDGLIAAVVPPTLEVSEMSPNEEVRLIVPEEPTVIGPLTAIEFCAVTIILALPPEQVAQVPPVIVPVVTAPPAFNVSVFTPSVRMVPVPT